MAARRRRSPSSDRPGRFRPSIRKPWSRSGTGCCSNNPSSRTGCPGSRPRPVCHRERKDCCCRSRPRCCTRRCCCSRDRNSTPDPDRRTWRRFRCCAWCRPTYTSRRSGRPRSRAGRDRHRCRRRPRCKRRRRARRKFRLGPCRFLIRINLRHCKRCPSSRRSRDRRRWQWCRLGQRRRYPRLHQRPRCRRGASTNVLAKSGQASGYSRQ